MQKILESSVFYRWLSAFFALVGAGWHRSRIVTWFLSQGQGRGGHGAAAAVGFSVTGKLFRALHAGLSFVFKKLRLTTVFKDSIFTQTYVWCLLPAVLAPFVPTMVALSLVVVGVLSFLIRYGLHGELRHFNAPVNKYILLFCFVYLIATFTSVSFSGSLLTGLMSVLFALFAIVFDNAVSTRRQAFLTVRLLVAAGAVVALYGVYQYFFFDPASAGAWVDSDMFSEITNRVYSTLENPNVLSEYLLLVIPFAFACILTAKTWPSRVLYAAITVVMLLCMLFTTSRGGWLGLIFAAALFLIMLDARFIFVGLLGIVLLYFVLPDWAIQRFTSIGDLRDSSTSYRFYIWMGTIDMLKDYWFTGIGPGTAAFNLIYPAYGFNTIAAPHAHNLYLQLICDCGIVGFVMFGMLLLSFFRMNFTAFTRTRDRETRVYTIAAVSAVSGFLVQGVTDYSFYNNRVTLLFWIVVGLGAILSRMPRMEEGTIWLRS